MSNKKDLLNNLFREASAYTNIDAIESLVEGGGNLAQIPVQPLYLAMKVLPMEKASTYLPMMSEEQRQACLDLDLWSKDDVDTVEFGFWVRTYALCPDEDIRKEFIGSPEFFLYLKSRFNIWTFDVEDPEYPDHDNYFLTDDSLLLFEFDDDFPYVNEVQGFVRELYGERGVEQAYSYLFKMVSGSFMEYQEEEYQEKKFRLRELGFVDYFDALQVENIFANRGLLENFLRKKKAATANLERKTANQNLHQTSIVAYKDKMGAFSDELGKIRDEKRSEYIQFSFIKLVNSTLSFGHALKEGPIAMTRIGNKTRSYLELGWDYITTEGKQFYEIPEDGSLFDLFDFLDIYQIGNSLIGMTQRECKKVLNQYVIEDKREAFLGHNLSVIIENAFKVPVFSSELFVGEFSEVKTFENFKNLERGLKLINEVAPFAMGFHAQLEKMKRENLVRDEFYLNYKVDDLDFETLLLTSLANFKLGQLDDEGKKLGLTINEYKKFAGMVVKGESLLSADELNQMLDDFISKFGLDAITEVKLYLLTLLESHMAGYDFESMAEEEFVHVGGPILLNLN